MAEEFATQKELNSYEDQVATALKANPFLSSDPSTLHAIGSASGVDAHGMGMLTNYNNLVDNVKTSIYDEANSSKNSGGWWHDVTSLADGAAQTVSDTAKGAASFLNRTATTVGEVGTLGFVGSRGKANGLGQMYSNLNDAFTTVKNLGSGLAAQVPTPDNYFGLKQASQMVSFFSSDAARHGVPYALGRITPLILASRFGEEALIGGTAEKIDAANLSALKRVPPQVKQPTTTLLVPWQFASVRCADSSARQPRQTPRWPTKHVCRAHLSRSRMR